MEMGRLGKQYAHHDLLCPMSHRATVQENLHCRHTWRTKNAGWHSTPYREKSRKALNHRERRRASRENGSACPSFCEKSESSAAAKPKRVSLKIRRGSDSANARKTFS